MIVADQEIACPIQLVLKQKNIDHPNFYTYLSCVKIKGNLRTVEFLRASIMGIEN